MEDERKAYVRKMKESRGYVFDFHKIMVAEDLPFIKKYNEMSEAAYTDPRLLDSKTKELLFVAILTAKGATQAHIKTHMNLALKHGATKQDLLQTLELCFMPCGATAFMWGFDAWKDVCNPERVEP